MRLRTGFSCRRRGNSVNAGARPGNSRGGGKNQNKTNKLTKNTPKGPQSRCPGGREEKKPAGCVSPRGASGLGERQRAGMGGMGRDMPGRDGRDVPCCTGMGCAVLCRGRMWLDGPRCAGMRRAGMRRWRSPRLRGRGSRRGWRRPGGDGRGVSGRFLFCFFSVRLAEDRSAEEARTAFAGRTRYSR